MSRRLLLPRRDRVRHRVSLPERDLLERNKLGGSIRVLSLPSWKVRPFRFLLQRWARMLWRSLLVAIQYSPFDLLKTFQST